jgi:capsular exopolysaccharide synthesis family protein
MADAAVAKRSRIVDPGAPSSEPFRTLRLALQLRSSLRSGNIVVVTSADAADGKSTVAANYALLSSFGHANVLLVDGDLRKPSIHELFDLPRAPGLVELLASGPHLEPFTHSVPTLGQLDVITAGRPIPRSGDLASSERMGAMLQQASKQYALVVIDSPPLLSSADAAGLATHPGVDVVLVTRKSSRRRQVLKALRKLDLIEANVAGIVVNREGRLATYGY